jgi:uncharacterized membrane protein
MPTSLPNRRTSGVNDAACVFIVFQCLLLLFLLFVIIVIVIIVIVIVVVVMFISRLKLRAGSMRRAAAVRRQLSESLRAALAAETVDINGK